MSEVTQGSVLKVDSLEEQSKKFLSDKAQVALGVKSNQMTHIDPDGKSFHCVYLGSHVHIDNVEEGVKRVSEQLNALAEDGLIHSALSGLVKIDFAKTPGREKSCMVLAYVLLPEAKAREIERDGGSLTMGEVPNCVDDLNLKLETGEFYTEIRLNIFRLKDDSYKSIDVILEEKSEAQINTWLRILPEGTKFVRKTKCSVFDTSVLYEVVFSNPIMAQIKEVSFNTVRTFHQELKNPSNIKQFDLITEVIYKDSKGERLFI